MADNDIDALLRTLPLSSAERDQWRSIYRVLMQLTRVGYSRDAVETRFRELLTGVLRSVGRIEHDYAN
jgi:hypothetical protein